MLHMMHTILAAYSIHKELYTIANLPVLLAGLHHFHFQAQVELLNNIVLRPILPIVKWTTPLCPGSHRV